MRAILLLKLKNLFALFNRKFLLSVARFQLNVDKFCIGIPEQNKREKKFL